MADGDGKGDNNGPLPHSQMVGVIIGCIALFAVISFVPIVIMWYVRRFSPRLPTSTLELHSSSIGSVVRQVSAGEWLRERSQGPAQTQAPTPTQEQPRAAEDDALDICFCGDERGKTCFVYPDFPTSNKTSTVYPLMICLLLMLWNSPICLSPLAVRSDDDPPLASLPCPEPALVHLSPGPVTSVGRYDGENIGREECSGDGSILVLRRCNHAFHSGCLAAWFRYRRHKCPLCQTPYFPVDPL